MKKTRHSKVLKTLNLYTVLQLLTVLLWEHSLAADTFNTPLTDSSKIIFWGTCAAVGLSLLYWRHLKRQSKKWRRRHIFADAEENILTTASQTKFTDSRLK